MKKTRKPPNITLTTRLILISIICVALTTCKTEVTPRENGTIQVCFTSQHNCTQTLINLIRNTHTIKAALYDLSQEEIISVLEEKHADILIDKNNYLGIGKKIRSKGLMHNKFWILDNHIITGSLNPTPNGFNKNDNNMIIINSKYLKKNYEEEFEEIKNNKEDRPTKYKKIILSGSQINNYFCPDDGCEDAILTTLRRVNHSIYFMTFSFTSDRIGDYLISMKNELDIRGVFEERQVKSQKQYTEYYKMIDNNMNVRLDGNKNNMHHKVFIIDNNTVITGSYNPTASGDKRNDENILIIHDPRIAKEYLEEFERVWGLAKTQLLTSQHKHGMTPAERTN